MNSFRSFFMLLAICVSLAAEAQADSIRHGLYKWIQPPAGPGITRLSILDGTARDFSRIQVFAAAVTDITLQQLATDSTAEMILLVKSGTLAVKKDDSIYKLKPGSMVMLFPGETIAIAAAENNIAGFYTMQFTARNKRHAAGDSISGRSFLCNWQTLQVKENSRGYRRDYFDRATVMCSRMEMHVTTLKEGLASHDPHRHPHEEIILNIDNSTEMRIGEEHFRGEPGDFYFITSGILHGVRNTGKGLCSYFAFRFE